LGVEPGFLRSIIKCFPLSQLAPPDVDTFYSTLLYTFGIICKMLVFFFRKRLRRDMVKNQVELPRQESKRKNMEKTLEPYMKPIR
jgi:hypothetical protein